MTKSVQHSNERLIDLANASDVLELNPSAENMWIEVIHKMDDIYIDLVHNQTELEEKNIALEDAQQFIRGVLAAMTDVLIACDVQGNIQQVNKALMDLTGKEESSVLKEPVTIFFDPSSHSVVESFQEKLKVNIITDCEVSLIDREGQPTLLAMNVSPRYDRDGSLVGMVLIGRPIGELRRAYDDLNRTHIDLQRTQQQLVHSEKMASLGRLVAGVAHELNNPISFVFGNMHALKRYGQRMSQYLAAIESGEEPEVLQELHKELKISQILADVESLIDGTLEGAERVSSIVQDLLRFSGNQKESISKIDLADIIETATQWVLNASSLKLNVEFDLQDNLIVNSRRGLLHQIIVNLIQNAVDVMDGCSDPKLNIASGTDKQGAWIKVHDNGPGINEQDLGKVFDPFFTTKPIGKGTGLGLYISYGLARDLGGELKVENHMHSGAVFTLSIPIKSIDDA